MFFRQDLLDSSHKSAKLHELVEQVGCRLLFLPRYSPDLNKIEPLWSQRKRVIAHHKNLFPSFRDAVDAAFA